MRTIEIQIYKRGNIWGENLLFVIDFDNHLELHIKIKTAIKINDYADPYVIIFDNEFCLTEYETDFLSEFYSFS